MRRFLIVVLAAALPATLGTAALGAGSSVRFRPNLQTLTPTDLSIEVLPNGHKKLRLTNEVSNVGAGPIELKPRKKDCDHDGKLQNDRTAFQRVYEDANANGVFDRGTDVTFHRHKVGCFEFDKAHGHWHFQDYARYELFELDGTLVRQHAKVGFCLLDTDQVAIGLPGEPASAYYGTDVSVCGDLDVQGVSVGWADIYQAPLPGQSIGIAGVPDGNYCLVSTVDPENLVHETDEGDNEARLQIQITGDAVTTVPGSC
ncbi:MAG TPA: lysyl oxidase family protein [Actinomycetota bacterium]